MNDTRQNTTEPPQPRREQWLVRLAVTALLALTVYVSFLLHAVAPASDRELSTILLFGGVVFACLGLLVPWQRSARVRAALHAPHRHLALASRVLGWFAAGLLPFVAVTAPWPVIGLVALLPLAAHELWRRRLWTVWVWYPSAVGLVPSFGGTVLLFAYFTLPGITTAIGEKLDVHLDATFADAFARSFVSAGALALLLFVARIAHETFLFHRSLANR